MTGWGFKAGGQLAIDLELIFLGGEGLAVDEQVFGAKKPDPLGPVELDGFQVADLFNVGGKDDLFSIRGDGGEQLHLVQFILHGGAAAWSAGRIRTASVRRG